MIFESTPFPSRTCYFKPNVVLSPREPTMVTVGKTPCILCAMVHDSQHRIDLLRSASERTTRMFPHPLPPPSQMQVQYATLLVTPAGGIARPTTRSQPNCMPSSRTSLAPMLPFLVLLPQHSEHG